MLVEKVVFRIGTAGGRVIALSFFVCQTGSCFLMTNQILLTTVVVIWGLLGKPLICGCQLSIRHKGG